VTDLLAFFGLLVVAVPAILGLALLGIMWRAWWLYPTWAWFVVPLGGRAIPFWSFAALLFLAQIATHATDDKKDDRPMDWAKLAIGLLWPMVAWVLLRWMRP